MNRIALLFAVASCASICFERAAWGGIAILLGDYNNDGIVSHADYSVLGDTFGSQSDLRADGNFDGVVDLGDFDVYAASYGNIASFGGILPLEIVATPLPSGNLEWTFTYSSVNGALAGHLNITSSETIVSVTGGPAFLDNGLVPVGVPGINSGGNIQEGISFTSNAAFVALGTTLTNPPALVNADATLEFVRLVTKAMPVGSTLTFSGEYGYQGLDYEISGSATFVPEPAALLLVGTSVWLLAAARFPSRRRNRGRSGEVHYAS